MERVSGKEGGGKGSSASRTPNSKGAASRGSGFADGMLQKDV